MRRHKQRCGAPLLRDLHALQEAQPRVREWARPLRARLGLDARRRARCYADTADHPCPTLAQRLRRHRGELFECVRVPGTNNEAERRLRPLVIARPVSGGTRTRLGQRLPALARPWPQPLPRLLLPPPL